MGHVIFRGGGPTFHAFNESKPPWCTAMSKYVHIFAHTVHSCVYSTAAVSISTPDVLNRAA